MSGPLERRSSTAVPPIDRAYVSTDYCLCFTLLVLDLRPCCCLEYAHTLSSCPALSSIHPREVQLLQPSSSFIYHTPSSSFPNRVRRRGHCTYQAGILSRPRSMRRIDVSVTPRLSVPPLLLSYYSPSSWAYSRKLVHWHPSSVQRVWHRSPMQ
ncbi:hypothetical protein BDZ89DRAFT_518560 [Hymenopellis radicata]|nr:hypothetical protein BDZ89DRAFT_518560 [Hymenopellis radicata]